MAAIEAVFTAHELPGDENAVRDQQIAAKEEKIALNGDARPGSSYFDRHDGSPVQPTVPVELAGSTPAAAPQELSAPEQPGRRTSIQFARPTLELPADASGVAEEVAVQDEAETPLSDRKNSGLLSKLKAFTVHHRAPSSHSMASNADPDRLKTPVGAPQRRSHELTRSPEQVEHSDSEEGDGSYEVQSRFRRKRAKRGDSQPVPIATSNPPRSASLGVTPDHPTALVTDSSSQPPPAIRRSTEPDGGATLGITETPSTPAVRSKVTHIGSWRRGHSHQNSLGAQHSDGQLSPEPGGLLETPRPNPFRRLTNFGRNEDGTQSPSAWRTIQMRSQSTSAANWSKMKAGLKAFGRKKKEERRDHVKSAELMAELTAGAPAAIILASHFKKDAKGKRRIPVLLEQLKVRIIEARHDKPHSRSDRHLILKIELEYGNGLTRMKWIISRELKDFWNLHVGYKTSDRKNAVLRRPGLAEAQKLPRFPKSVFPYLRGVRGLGSEDDDFDTIDEETAGEQSGTEGRASRRQKSVARAPPSRRSSIASITADEGTPGQPKEGFSERQRRKMEEFLQAYIRCMMFRPDSNRLCKFFELSALGVRLSGEASYHGKEGPLIIASSKGLDFRRNLNVNEIKSRHSPKWFMVRHSYVVYVDSPQDMNIYDVFLVDSDFDVKTKGRDGGGLLSRSETRTDDNAVVPIVSTSKHHTLKLHNSERDMKLWGKSERIVRQFDESIRFMKANSIWANKQRFASFAPVRQNCFAQWLVDGRDYMWNVSRAINMAKDVIYIHDWWLSPEIYMRRPPAISQKWRLDRLLQRKAAEGVKVFIIVYRNIGAAIPIDSAYTKYSLLDLHPNIFVQRSPNQYRQNTFFWAHHEKICVVDHCLAFVGGIDLCFGRWDTPQHSVSDDKQTGFEPSALPKDADHCQLWAGKDYSNPRVQDFYELDKPYDEMYDRNKVPRMPWHDISMQVVGQPARDLSRHFVQRWNYILRQRKPSRPTPFLLPPPDFTDHDIELLGLKGTCEVQITRSCSSWSIGYQDKTEHSILNAYCKLIEQSEHFVYIENQFFISSCEWEGTRIENTIGDALVDRIIKASENDEDWRAVIVIPLMPGFQNTVDAPDGTSVRLIMSCQYASISRGESSIFGRLRARDIEPEDYIQFYSLRQWGKLGPSKMLVTEQLYIHAKCMVVDDRMAIIGSANINERSMLGSRDSEVAAVVRDSDMLWSTMNGEPYLVGRFPHTLRLRLMREHLGLDVDEIMDQERRDHEKQRAEEWQSDISLRQSRQDDPYQSDDSSSPGSLRRHNGPGNVRAELLREELHSVNHDGYSGDGGPKPKLQAVTKDDRVTGNAAHEADVAGKGPDQMTANVQEGFGGDRDSEVEDIAHNPTERLVRRDIAESSHVEETGKLNGSVDAHLPSQSALLNNASTSSDFAAPRVPQETTVNGTTHQVPPLNHSSNSSSKHSFTRYGAAQFGPLLQSLKQRPSITTDCMRDPLADSFFLDTWQTVAENNTKIYRAVFRCMPDNEVQTWKEYKEYVAYGERFAQMQGMSKDQGIKKDREGNKTPTGPPGTGLLASAGKLGRVFEEVVGHGEKGKVDEKGGAKSHPGASRSSTRKDSSSSTIDKSGLADWAEKANKMQMQRRATKESMKSLTSNNLETPGLDTLDEKAELKTGASEADKKALGPPPDTRHEQSDDTRPPVSEVAQEKARIDEATSAREREQAAISRNATTSSESDPVTFPAINRQPDDSTTDTSQPPPAASATANLPTSGTPPQQRTTTSSNTPTGQSGTPLRRRRGTTRSSRREFQASEDLIDRQDAEALLSHVQGHLINFPYDWLIKEESGGNWLYSIDQLAPIEIYD